MQFKFSYLIIGLIVLSFASCVARKPPEPATVIQMQTPEASPEGEEVIDQVEEDQPEDPGELQAYQEYSADYLAALSATGDLAEAEWNTGIRCRAAAIAQSAQMDAEENNTGLEAELIKRLRAVNNDAKAKVQGKRFYAHDASGFADFRDPGADVIVLVNLLQLMQEDNPSFPLCTQNAGSLWRSVDQILEAADQMARTDPKSVPVRVPNEVAQDESN